MRRILAIMLAVLMAFAAFPASAGRGGEERPSAKETEIRSEGAKRAPMPAESGGEKTCSTIMLPAGEPAEGGLKDDPWISVSPETIYKYLYDEQPAAIRCEYGGVSGSISITAWYNGSICDVEWGSWNGNTIYLYVYAVGEGKGSIDLTLQDSSDTVVASVSVALDIEGDPWVSASMYSITVGQHDTEEYSVYVYYGGYLPEGLTLRCSIENSEICDGYWTGWVDDYTAELMLYGCGTRGSTTVLVTLLDYDEQVEFDSIAIQFEVMDDLSEAINHIATDNFLSFAPESDYPFTLTASGSRDCAVSSNGGVSDSVSELYSCAVLMAGDTVSFDYYYSTEPDNDLFCFYMNGSKKLERSGAGSGWVSKSFTASYSGRFELLWTYTKDGSIDYGDDRVMIDNVRITRCGAVPDEPGAALNTGEEQLNFVCGNYGFVSDAYYGDSAAVSENWGVDYSEAMMQATVYMKPSDTFSFKYLVSSEEGYDFFLFYIDGELEFFRSGLDTSWRKYTYTAQKTGCVTFAWIYYKDSSVSMGMDCVRIKETVLTRRTPVDLIEALNAEGDCIDFYNSDSYPFKVKFDDKGPYGVSGNHRVSSSTSSVAALITMHAGDRLTFEYCVSSQENRDLFIFGEENRDIFTRSGTGGGWYSATFTADDDRTYYFIWRYVKDGSGSFGDDCVKLRNVHFVDRSNDRPGDVDGSGAVDTTDALLALRKALGIIELDVFGFARADVDRNGLVDTTDALMILRAALGIAAL